MSTEGGDGQRQWGQPSAQDTGTATPLGALARRLARRPAEAERSLQRQTSPQQVMDGDVHLARELVPGAGEATITMVRDDRHRYPAAATSTLASDFDVLQDETGKGPGRDRAWTPSGSNGPFTSTTWPVIRAGRSSALGLRNAEFTACRAFDCSCTGTRSVRWTCWRMPRRPSPVAPGSDDNDDLAACAAGS